MTTMLAHQFGVGDHVFLRGCRAGQPGTIIRFERGKAVVYWRDMDHWSRHRPDSLVLVAPPQAAEDGQ